METPQPVQDLISRLLTQEADLLMKASEHQEKARELRAEAVSLSQRRDDIKFVIDAFLATPDKHTVTPSWPDLVGEASASQEAPQPSVKKKSKSAIILEAVREQADTVAGLRRRTGINVISPYLSLAKRHGLISHELRTGIWSARNASPSLSKKDLILSYLSNHKPSLRRHIADGVDYDFRKIANYLYELERDGKVSLDRKTHLWSLA